MELSFQNRPQSFMGNLTARRKSGPICPAENSAHRQRGGVRACSYGGRASVRSRSSGHPRKWIQRTHGREWKVPFRERCRRASYRKSEHREVTRGIQPRKEDLIADNGESKAGQSGGS